jgi:hypothetical protein
VLLRFLRTEIRFFLLVMLMLVYRLGRGIYFERRRTKVFST